MVIWIVIGTSLLKPPSPLSALIFHLLSFVSCLTSPWKLQVRRVLGLGLGFYILFIHYYRVICRSSDHTMGSPLADIRTRDGLPRSRDTKPHKPPHSAANLHIFWQCCHSEGPQYYSTPCSAELQYCRVTDSTYMYFVYSSKNTVKLLTVKCCCVIGLVQGIL